MDGRPHSFSMEKIIFWAVNGWMDAWIGKGSSIKSRLQRKNNNMSWSSVTIAGGVVVKAGKASQAQLVGQGGRQRSSHSKAYKSGSSSSSSSSLPFSVALTIWMVRTTTFRSSQVACYYSYHDDDDKCTDKSLLDDRGRNNRFCPSAHGPSFVLPFLFGWSASYDLNLSSMETGWRFGAATATILQPPTASAATIK
jgi:hypothetical protein